MSLSTEQIAEKYYPDIYKFCCAKCRDKEAAQDITQETFLFLVNKYEELADSNIRSWLLSVAERKVHEYFRKNKNEKSFVSIEDVEISTNDQYEQNQIDIEEIFDDVQKKILNILNENEKEIFIKLYIEKKSVDLVTEELNITNENLRARKSRMKRKVKKSIGHLYFFAFVFFFKNFHYFL